MTYLDAYHGQIKGYPQTQMNCFYHIPNKAMSESLTQQRVATLTHNSPASQSHLVRSPNMFLIPLPISRQYHSCMCVMHEVRAHMEAHMQFAIQSLAATPS